MFFNLLFWFGWSIYSYRCLLYFSNFFWFEKLLFKYKKGIENHKIVLKQFDVYDNKRSSLLPSVIGGLIGAVLTSSSDNTEVENPLILDVVHKDYPIKTEENAVGCDNEMEGEYYESRIPKGYDAIVSWFKFSVDGEEYHYRVVYPYYKEDKRKVNEIVADGIEKSIELIATKI